MGSTDLAGGFRFIEGWPPRQTIVISDGLPDDARAAAAITGSIDTIYCGHDGDAAIEFLRRLSRDSGGQQAFHRARRPGCRSDRSSTASGQYKRRLL
ncbi:MAG TPA: hypothetical protein VKT49_20760 [Bryobacteraceae bacterium]|nr:hypothetical protein [Bryobacteraceae bacterium]